MTLISAVVLIFFVMDPLGNVPLFLSALRHVDPARHRRIIVRELFIALIVMIAFLFTGRYLLSVLHVSPAALTAAGGVILLLIALRMIFPSSERTLRGVSDRSCPADQRSTPSGAASQLVGPPTSVPCP